MKTVMHELKEKLEYIKNNNCESFMEMLFFDGVLAIIDTEFLEKEKHQIIEAFSCGRNGLSESPNQYFNETFKNERQIT